MQDAMKNMMTDMWKGMDSMKGFDFTKNLDFMKDFNASKIGLQILDFQKSTFNNTYNTLVKIQEQSEKITDSLLKDNSAIPAEGRKIVDEWKLVFKKGQNELKKSIDESFNKAESFFVESSQPAKAAK
ncbi:MAG: hypothetical protein KKD44_03680 [Proteobacteria bacterium]|nr:hypothetical protein [Pseudomonadota bacterium]